MGGLVSNLTEGLANAAGDQNTVARIENQRQYERGLAQQELGAKTQQILTGVQALQQRRAQLPAGDPQLADIDQALTQHQQALVDLYHPNNNPGALQHLVGFIKQHIGGQRPQAVQSNAVTPERMGGLAASAAGTEPFLTPEEAHKRALIQAGIEPKAVMLRPYKDSDYKQGLQRFVESMGGDPDNPTADEEQAYQRARTEATTHHRDRYAWSKTTDGRFVNVKLDRDNQPIAGTENYDLLPPPGLTGRITTGQYHFVDDQGNIHQIQETRTSTPAAAAGPGTYQPQGANIPAAAPTARPAAAPPSKQIVPQTPGQARQQAATVAPRTGAKGDRIIGFKGNKDWADTNQQYQQAIDRQSTMDQNYKDALATGSQQAMLSLVANHIGMTLGAQKGARINQAVWNEAIASAPWTESFLAKAFHQDQNGDYVFDGWKGGVTLTAPQMAQMVKLAHEKVNTLAQHIDRLKKQNAAQPTPTTQGPAPTGNVVSLAKARQLPAMKGKSDDQIRQLIEAQGHQVVP